MNKLLIDDYPIQVLPKLAVEIGLNEAIVLQQVHYWLNKSTHYHDGRKWVYNTYDGWQEQFPFWSVMTIRRVLSNLEKNGYLITGNFNKAGFDKTKWYTIDYECVKRVNRRCVQNEQTMCSDCTDGLGQFEQTNTIDYTEITTEKKDTMSGKPDNVPYQDIVEYLNLKSNKSFKASSSDTRKLIKARYSEGFTLEDFKKVIDNKCFDWCGDREMNKYLRPKTLFSTKFESYLNENKVERVKKGYTHDNHIEGLDW